MRFCAYVTDMCGENHIVAANERGLLDPCDGVCPYDNPFSCSRQGCYGRELIGLANYHLPSTNYGRNRQDRIGVSAADTAADEGARDVAGGAGASDERVAAVHNKGAAPGRELLLPHGGEARQRIEDGLLPGAASAGGRTSRLTTCNRKVKL